MIRGIRIIGDDVDVSIDSLKGEVMISEVIETLIKPALVAAGFHPECVGREFCDINECCNDSDAFIDSEKALDTDD